MMAARGTTVLLWGVLGLLACDGPPRGEEAARSAFERLIRALDERDAATLWSLADDETHALFDGLASEINDALVRIEGCFPEELRGQARKAVGGEYLFRGGRGEDLFRALLDPNMLRAPKDPQARSVLRVAISRREAVVVTGTHDIFRFEQDREGQYRTDVFRKALTRQAALSDLRKNLEAVRRDCPEAPASPPIGGHR